MGLVLYVEVSKHNPAWDHYVQADSRGLVVQDLLEEKSLVTLNDDTVTLTFRYQGVDTPDLSINHDDSSVNFNWEPAH